MNFADLETTWRSPLNQPDRAELETLKMNLVAELEHHRRGQRRFLFIVFVVLTAISVAAVGHLVAPRAGADPTHLSREWGLLPLLLLPWAGWAVMFRLHRRHLRAHPEYGASIRHSVAAALDENRRERLRTWCVGAVLVLSLPLLGIAVLQLRATGKAGDEILVPAMVLFPLYVCGTLGALAWRYLKKLQPRRHKLETLLREYAAE